MQSGLVRRAGQLAAAAAVLTVGLIAYGAWVRASGSGLGCPDWPLCYGTVAPHMAKPVWIEWGHRLFAGVVVLTVAGAAWTARRAQPSDGGLFRLLASVLGLLLVQAVLGGIVVLTELNNLAVLVHLALAMASLSLMVLAAVSALAPGVSVPLGRGTVLGLVGGGALVILLGSSLVATNVWANCPGLPLCDGRTDVGPGALHYAHRLGAAALFVALLAAGLRLRRSGVPVLVKGAVHGALGVLVAQGVVGVAGVHWVFPEPVRVLHLGLAGLAWACLSLLWALWLRGRAA